MNVLLSQASRLTRRAHCMRLSQMLLTGNHINQAQLSTAASRSMATISTTVLSRDTRLAVSESLAETLKTSYNTTSAVLCASLIADDDEATTKEALIEVLLARVREANSDDVLEVARSTQWLENALLNAISNELAAASTEDKRRSSQSPAAEPDETSTVHLLRCAQRLVSGGVESTLLTNIAAICLKLVCSEAKQVAFAARLVLSSVMLLDDHAERSAQEIRECISFRLLSDQALPFQQTLGYSLWLRQLSCTPSYMLAHIGEPRYWDSIASGLRYGDGERRKLCLEILKLSVKVAADGGRIDLIVDDKTASPSALIDQYTRYCTVYETLALARYQDLLLRTEKDLNHLASSASLVDSRWLYVLLHTALSPEMLDQNRKVVGTWILNDNLKRKTPIEQLCSFLKKSFLPWVTEGHRFVSTIKLSTDHTWRCRHGERLSAFVVSMITSRPGETGPLLDAHLHLLERGSNNMFLPAAMYIMDGLAECAQHLSLTSAQIEVILQLSSWQAFPDFAKTFIRRCCWTLIHSSNTSSETIGGLSDALKAHHDALCTHYSSAGTMSVLRTSEREKKTQQALQKCLKAQDIDSASTILKLCEAFEDIWSDADYLVYPRELLLEIPKTFLSSNALRLCSSDEPGAEELRIFVRESLRQMLKLTETRSYIFGPLTAATRKAVFTTSGALQVIDLEQYILQIANAPPQPKVDLQFEYAASHMLQKRFSQDDYKVANEESRGMAMYLDLVSRLQQHQQILRSIANAIVARWLRQKIPPPTISAFKTTMQLRVLVLCCQQLETLSTAETKEMLDNLFFLLSIEPLMQYRFLFSWSILILLMRNPEQQDQLLRLLGTKDHHSNPKYLAAIMKLSVELASTNRVSEDFALKLASTFIALSASSKVVIRHEAQWSFPLLTDLARANQWNKIIDNNAFSSLDDYIRNLPRFDEPPTERTQTRFHPIRHNTMANLAEGRWTELENARPSMARRSDFLWLQEQDQHEGLTLPQACTPLGEPSDDRKHLVTQTDEESPANGSANKQAEQTVVTALQTKGSAYLENLLQGDDAAKTKQHQLVVLASLVTNPYNLGGLSRVSEIFGAQALYVRDPKVVAEKDFTSVAVSSHHHIDIRQLAEQDIAAFLTDMKAQGWTVIGVEQTDRSDILGTATTQLPTKTILVIGNERDGMPGNVISDCDVLVEIPQRGVTRSMNVQTVAAVVLYEFNRQHS